jgi:hypothetical protein
MHCKYLSSANTYSYASLPLTIPRDDDSDRSLRTPAAKECDGTGGGGGGGSAEEGGGMEGEEGGDEGGVCGEESDTVSVLCGTWNLGGKPCPDLSLAAWLSPEEFDLYVIGAQEVPKPETLNSKP